ncbi:MAG: hypothetical protein A07HB70_01157 [uncultured archaeon A07HB70]|nr:MAG: hypothetical protein A07HB70_01157 [uncultured archaeon A07HB70]
MVRKNAEQRDVGGRHLLRQLGCDVDEQSGARSAAEPPDDRHLSLARNVDERRELVVLGVGLVVHRLPEPALADGPFREAEGLFDVVLGDPPVLLRDPVAGGDSRDDLLAGQVDLTVEHDVLGDQLVPDVDITDSPLARVTELLFQLVAAAPDLGDPVEVVVALLLRGVEDSHGETLRVASWPEDVAQHPVRLEQLHPDILSSAPDGEYLIWRGHVA